MHLIDVYKRINRKYFDTRKTERRADSLGGGGGSAALRRSVEGRSGRTSGSGGKPKSMSPSPPSAFRSALELTTSTSVGWKGPTDPRDILHDRYVVGRVVGRGAFGFVIVAYDMVNDVRVAMKIIKKGHDFDSHAKREIEVLRVLGGGGGGRGEGEGKNVGHPCVVSLLDSFTHVGRVDKEEGGKKGASSDAALPAYRCLVFELLSHSLYNVLQSTKFHGVSLGLIRKFTKQLVSALAYLRSHGVVHCDLKPENVLLCGVDRSAIKLIDFGSSGWAGETDDNTYVQSRFYRAPEVILGLPYGCAVDVWSLGCIMVEMHGGKPLFPGKDERDQLWKISEALGSVPSEMASRAPPEKRAVHFPVMIDREIGECPVPGSKPLRSTIIAVAKEYDSWRGESLNRERSSGADARGAATSTSAAEAAMLSLHELGIRDDDESDARGTDGRAAPGGHHARRRSIENLTEVALFYDFVERALTWSPSERLKPNDAIEHLFLGGGGGGTSVDATGGVMDVDGSR